VKFNVWREDALKSVRLAVIVPEPSGDRTRITGDWARGSSWLWQLHPASENAGHVWRPGVGLAVAPGPPELLSPYVSRSVSPASITSRNAKILGGITATKG